MPEGNHGTDTAGRCLLISADCHASPPPGGFRPHVEGALLEDFDQWAARMQRHQSLEGMAEMAGAGKDIEALVAQEQVNYPGLADPAIRRRDLDADGVAAEIIFPNMLMPFALYPETASSEWRWETVEQAVAGIRTYNRWLAELCAADRDRHIGVAVVQFSDLDAAVAEVEWARANGLNGGVLLPPISVTGDYPPFNDQAYDKFWATCAALGMPVNVHTGGNGQHYGHGAESIALFITEQNWFSRRPLWFLVLSGVFERHPALRLVFTEQMAHWIPDVLEELDSVYDMPFFRALRDQLPHRPSEYWHSNCYVGATGMSRREAEARHEIGVDRIMWGSDYPHLEGTFPHTAESIRKTYAGMPADEVALILGGNAARCYGLDLTTLGAIANEVGPRWSDLETPLERIPDTDRARLGLAFRESVWT
jgi:predicted TIM-barrel fold metal-dependent hydrolase